MWMIITLFISKFIWAGTIPNCLISASLTKTNSYLNKKIEMSKTESTNFKYFEVLRDI